MIRLNFFFSPLEYNMVKKKKEYNIVMSFPFLCNISENIGSETDRSDSLSLVLRSDHFVRVMSTRFHHGKGITFSL